MTTIDGGIAGGAVTNLAFSQRGELFATGGFVTAGGETSVNVARALTNCPAMATPFGAGCNGSQGLVELTSNDRPWLNNRFDATTTGMPPLSLAVQAIGLQAVNLPLPLGAAGCSLLVDPLQLALLVPEGGAADGSFFVPSTMSLLGQSLFMQVIGVELDATPAIQQLTSSNALHLVVGQF